MESEQAEKLDGWIQQDAEAARVEREKAMADSGMKPFLKLEEGEVSFEVDRKTKPRSITTKNGPMKVLALLNPADKELGCSDYLYSVIVEKLAAQAHGKIRLLRTGKAKETKYKCLEVKG